MIISNSYWVKKSFKSFLGGFVKNSSYSAFLTISNFSKNPGWKKLRLFQFVEFFVYFILNNLIMLASDINIIQVISDLPLKTGATSTLLFIWQNLLSIKINL